MKPHSLLIIIALLAGVFYWFQWRPAQIRNGCTWVAYHWRAGNIVRNNLTETERAILKNAPDSTTGLVTSSDDQQYWRKFAADKFADYKANFFTHENGETWMPTGWERATDGEYRSCIRENGLMR